MMQQLIINELNRIESEHNVKIIYACESGSRSWGFPSQDSDYDVRFIYLHPVEWYLSIAERRDVIELPINDLLDINGWDLQKALKLFRKSNPPLLEWLQSSIIYWEKYSITQKLRDIRNETFSPRSCLYHYLSMAKGNFREYLQGDLVKVKKYFYVLRPILACLWIRQNNTMPPIEFEGLVNAMVPAGALKQEIETLLMRKKAGVELDLEPRIDIINDFLSTEIESLDDYSKNIARKPEKSVAELDQLFIDALAEVFG